MEKIINITYKPGIRDRLTGLFKKITIISVFAWALLLSSCTATYRNRGYDTYDRDGYYQRQGDVGYNGSFRDRMERRRWEREHRRWHRLHDRGDYRDTDRDDDHGGIIIGR